MKRTKIHLKMVVSNNLSSRGFSCKSDFLLMKIREQPLRPHERGRMRKPKTRSPVRRHLHICFRLPAPRTMFLKGPSPGQWKNPNRGFRIAKILRKPQCIQGETVLQHKTTSSDSTWTCRLPHTLTNHLSLTYIRHTLTTLINWLSNKYLFFMLYFQITKWPKTLLCFLQLFFKHKSKPSRIRNKRNHSWPRRSIFHCNAAKLDLLKEHFRYYTLGHIWHKKLERKLFSPQREVC